MVVVVVVDMRLCNVTPAGWLAAGWSYSVTHTQLSPSPGELSRATTVNPEERRGFSVRDY